MVDSVLKKDMAGWWIWLETSSTGRKVIKYYCCFFSDGIDDFFLVLKPEAAGWMPFQLSGVSVDGEERITFSDRLGIDMLPFSHLTYKKNVDEGGVLFGKPGRGEAFLKRINTEAIPQFVVQDLKSWFARREETGEGLSALEGSIPVCFRPHLERVGAKDDTLPDEDFVSEPDSAWDMSDERVDAASPSGEYEASGRHTLMQLLESKLRHFKWELSSSEEKRNDFVKTIIGSIVIVFILRLTF